MKSLIAFYRYSLPLSVVQDGGIRFTVIPYSFTIPKAETTIFGMNLIRMNSDTLPRLQHI